MDSYPIDLAPLYELPGEVPTGQLDLLCFSHLRWDFVTQRPQHLLRRAVLTRRVFYWEEPIWHKEGDFPLNKDGSLGMNLEIVQAEPSLWIVRPHITWGIDFEAGQRALLMQFQQWAAIERFVLWYFTPMAHGFSSHLIPEATVYDCMDELTGFLGASSDLGMRERKLFAAADVVFTGGISLFEAKQKQHPNVLPFPSSIDFEHFAQAREESKVPDPADQADIPHPRVGFYGVVDERFDISLLSNLASLRPDMNFVILGPVVKIDPATLPSAANIYYLGSKTYEKLPAYLSGWDVAILPFALNDATRFISPTKTPEYLAAGKPVVSTPIRDVVRGYGDLGLVAIAATAEDFAAALDRALLPRSVKWQQAVKSILSSNSWDATWVGMDRQIELAIKTRKESIRNQNGEVQSATARGLPYTRKEGTPRVVAAKTRRAIVSTLTISSSAPVWRELDSSGIRPFFEACANTSLDVRTSEDVVMARVGSDLLHNDPATHI